MKHYSNPEEWEDENEQFTDDDNETSNEWDYLKDAFGDDAETVYWNID